jgi:hypothetical protein
MRRCELQMLVLSVPVDVEELLVAGPGVDSLAQAVPGVVGAVGEVEGVGRELGLEPGDVCRGCGDGRMGCGGGGRWRAGAEVAGAEVEEGDSEGRVRKTSSAAGTVSTRSRRSGSQIGQDLVLRLIATSL